MFRQALVFLFLLIAFCVHGQQPNPFDLKFRTPATKNEAKKTPPILTDTAVRTVPSQNEISPKKDTITNILPSKDDLNPFDLDTAKEESDEDVAISTTKTDADIETGSPGKPPTQKSSKGLQIFFLLLSLLFLIFIVNVERSFVKDLWRVISNENYSSLHLRNQRNTMRQILLLMGYMVFFIQAGIFLYHLLRRFHYDGTLLDNIWTCMALVMGVYLVRHSVIRYLRWLFNNEKEMTLFGFDVSIFNIMVGLVLLPINVMLNFGPESLINPLIYIGIIAFLAAYLMRQLRWMLTARQLITNSLFLFFVYLCAVEILPLWAISKLFW